MTTDELRENLLNAPKNGYTKLTAQQRTEMESYCKRYAAFMDACKTERESTTWLWLRPKRTVLRNWFPAWLCRPVTRST